MLIISIYELSFVCRRRPWLHRENRFIFGVLANMFYIIVVYSSCQKYFILRLHVIQIIAFPPISLFV